MTLDLEGRISARYLRYTDVKESVGATNEGLDIPKLAKNLVQRRVSFSAAET